MKILSRGDKFHVDAYGPKDAIDLSDTYFTNAPDVAETGDHNITLLPAAIGAALDPADIPITDSGAFFDAANAEAALAETADYRMKAYTRTFDHADTDIAVAAASAAIDFGSALPAGAIVHAVLANVTEAYDNSADTFTADVGISSGDADAYTPTALDLSTGVAVLTTQTVNTKASAVQLAVTITSSSGDLDTLTAGTVVITVLYFVPDETVIAAP